MRDYHTHARLQWLRQLSRRYKKNAKGIEAEERAYYLSERFALIASAVIVFAVLQEILL